MSELVQILAQATRADLTRLVASLPGVSPMLRAAAGAALGLVTEADFAKYRGLVLEVYGALQETERGRAVLASLGIE